MPYRTAAECIDWSDLGTSIFDRKRPLKDKTLGRIAEGIRRYVLNDPAPFLLRVTQSDGARYSPVDGPMPTQTTRQDLAVCTPIIAPQNTGVYGQRMDEPGPTITGKGHQSLITPILATTGYGEAPGQTARVHRVHELLGTAVDGVKQALVSPLLAPAGGPKNTPHRADEPMRTVIGRESFGLVSPVLAYHRHGGGQHSDLREPVLAMTAGGLHAGLVAALMLTYYGNTAAAQRADQSLGAVTTLDRHGLVSVVIDGATYVIIDILFRMLRPRELAKAMGFDDGYQWPKTQRDTVRLIGNAVSPPQAAAIIGATLPRGGVKKGRVAS